MHIAIDSDYVDSIIYMTRRPQRCTSSVGGLGRIHAMPNAGTSARGFAAGGHCLQTRLARCACRWLFVGGLLGRSPLVSSSNWAVKCVPNLRLEVHCKDQTTSYVCLLQKLLRFGVFWEPPEDGGGRSLSGCGGLGHIF